MKIFHSENLRFAACRPRGRRPMSILTIALVSCALCLPARVDAQQSVSDDFNNGTDVGWTHYDPEPATTGGGIDYSFPDDGMGGSAYRMFGKQATNNLALFQRGGSIRGEQYADFSMAVDIVNHNEKLVGNSAFLGARLTTPGALSTSGYIVAFSLGGPRNPQELMLAVQFTGEVNATTPDIDTGGASLMPYLPASRKLRCYFTGIGNNFISEIYDQTDLLEPIARSSFTDDTWASGQNGVGFLNAALSPYAVDDVTFDNYFSTGSTNIGILTGTPFIGYPGTPQVVNLKPAPQTLFYKPPGNGTNITFTLTTFTTNQINTNALKMFLNGTDVTSQLILDDKAFPPLLGTPRTNLSVRYTGTLATNTIYQGQIRVVDFAGKGTTNNWVFDTFTTNGILTIEAEDYNYGGGQFFDNPPVSGLDRDGNQVNGGGLGYFDLEGVPCVDFNDLDRQGVDRAARQQYRPDKVGTIQARVVSADTRRPSYIASNMNDYVVLYCKAGEWLNYTRTFPSGNYNVYLRASSQKAQAVRLDEVTSGSSSYIQTLAIRGEFLVPNTSGSTRFRYVPLTDAAGNLLTLNLAGVKTLRLTELDSSQLNSVEVGDLQMNYLLFVPAAAAPSPRLPWIAFASPPSGAVNADPDLNLKVVILNADTSVNAGSIVLRFDGTNVTSSATITTPSTEGPGANVRYRPGLLLPNTSHTISVVYSDNASHTVSNQWSFTVEDWPMLTSADATGGSPSTQFTVKMNKSQDADVTAPPDAWPNDSFRAELQIAGRLSNSDDTSGAPFPNEAAGSGPGQTIDGVYTASVINFQANGNNAGFFAGDTRFPGVLTDNPKHMAMAATIDLLLTNGVYAMGCDANGGHLASGDGGHQLTAGGLAGTNVYIGSSETFPGSTDRGEFETFVVKDTGVYRFRLLYFNQKSSDPRCEWWWVDDRKTGTGRRLVNTSSAAVTTIPASYAHASGGVQPGFTIQMAKSPEPANQANSSARAENQLAGGIDPNTGLTYVNEALGTNNGIYYDQNINYELAGNLQGYFCGDRTFPGIGPSDPGWNGGNPDNIAMAATALLQLSAGKYVFGVRSDDGFKVSTGANPPYTDLVLGTFEGGRGSAETQFSFIAPVDGLYPMRLLYYQGGGGADCEFYSFDFDSGQRVLINDPNNGNSIKAYRIFRILNPRGSGNNFRFDFETVTGKTYTVEYKNSLTDTSWTSLPPSITGDGTIKTVTYTSTSPTKRFYHVRVN